MSIVVAVIIGGVADNRAVAEINFRRVPRVRSNAAAALLGPVAGNGGVGDVRPVNGQYLEAAASQGGVAGDSAVGNREWDAAPNPAAPTLSAVVCNRAVMHGRLAAIEAEAAGVAAAHIARDDAVLHQQRTIVKEAAGGRRGRVTGDDAVQERQCPVHTPAHIPIGDTAAEESGVAAHRAVLHSQRPPVVDAAAVADHGITAGRPADDVQGTQRDRDGGGHIEHSRGIVPAEAQPRRVRVGDGHRAGQRQRLRGQDDGLPGQPGGEVHRPAVAHPGDGPAQRSRAAIVEGLHSDRGRTADGEGAGRTGRDTQQEALRARGVLNGRTRRQ